MPVEIDIAHVAKLARLDLTPDEMEGYRSQLGVILEHAAKVQSLEGDPEAHPEGDVTHPLGLVNAFRDDEVRPSLDRAEVLASAPESRDGYYVVPPALEI